MNANPITFEIDFDNDDILIHSVLEGRQQVNRLRILHAWVLLYCLDPDRFEDGCRTMIFCERVMAFDPPIGLTTSQDVFHFCLPDGWLDVQDADRKEVAEALERKLREYTESIGIEVDGGDCPS